MTCSCFLCLVKSAVRPGNSNPTLPKPPPVINKGKSISAATEKRASLAASQANKLGNDKTTIGVGNKHFLLFIFVTSAGC